ncbi:MAG: hypothetical protein HS100_21215 [Anaerolineales bacterium]|nr:hypothetical protein [Anaerolineales bacterium]
MDNRLENDALIEDALSSQPLAPMPRDIAPELMARIRVEKRPALVTWKDLAVASAIVLSVIALFVSAQSLPPVVLAKLRLQGILLYHGFISNARLLIPAQFAGLAWLLAGIGIPALIRLAMDDKP